MSGFLGIDHPLILVRDLDAAIARFTALGFTMAPQSRHPWGTSTCIAIMERSLIELVSIYDEALLDELPAGDFRFGRFVQKHLSEREGISLTALNSESAADAAAVVTGRGVECQGTIDFGRDVKRPDGTLDRTSTTLKILASNDLPRLSNFICQQHRPDLIYVPKWSSHANGARSYSQVTVLAHAADQPRVRSRLVGIYGREALFDLADGFGATTGNGSYVVTDLKGVERRYGAVPAELKRERQPCCVAIHVRVPDIERMPPILLASSIRHRLMDGEVRLADAAEFGNVFVNFTATGKVV